MRYLKKALTFFLPHEDNQHHPLLLRHPFLATFFILLVTVQVSLNLFYSSDPRVLGFATSIYQQELVKLTNQEREKQGLPALTENSTLDQAAQLKAVDMLSKDYWAHVAPDGVTPWYWFEKTGYTYVMAGENLAKDFNTSAGVVRGWLNSPTHRDNLLNKNFTEIGMAVVNGKLQGEETTLVVQLFGTPIPTQLAVKKVLAQELQPVPTIEIQPQSALAPISSAVELTSQGLKPLGVPAEALSGIASLEALSLIALNPASWSLGQQITLMALLMLMLLFISDSLILWRKGTLRRNSHSLLHAGVLGVLLVGIIYSSVGLVL